MESLETTWKKFIAGDEAAYGNIYQKFIQDLYQYGLCFTPDEDIVKDCIQDLFVYLYANRSHLDPVCNIKTYLLISLKHNICRYLFKHQSFDSLEENYPFLSEISAEDHYIENESSHNESLLVKKMLAILTPRQREIMYYRFVQELSMDDICKLMDLHYQSAQNLIQRSLKKIKSQFGEIFIYFFIAAI